MIPCWLGWSVLKATHAISLGAALIAKAEHTLGNYICNSTYWKVMSDMQLEKALIYPCKMLYLIFDCIKSNYRHNNKPVSLIPAPFINLALISLASCFTPRCSLSSITSTSSSKSLVVCFIKLRK